MPENSLLLTPKGFCFPNEIIPGTEILIVNADKKLSPYTITDEIPEPELYLTKTLLSQSLTCTLIPSYKIILDDEAIDPNSLQIDDSMPIVNRQLIKDYEIIQENQHTKNLESSPISITVATYLAQFGLNQNRHKAVFEQPDEQSAREFGKRVHDELRKEIGGDVSYFSGVKNYHTYGNRRKSPSWKIFFENNKFYELRETFNFDSDKINNEIYSNGFYLFFTFLRNFLISGFPNHIRYFVRSDNTLLLLPWNGKLRKLFQNFALIWNKYKLSFYVTPRQRNIDELKITSEDIYQSTQNILEIKDTTQKCYKIDIPFGSKLIIDFTCVKPIKLNDSEIEKLQEYQVTESQIDFKKLRKKIISNFSRQTAFTELSNPLKTITQIIGADKWKLHIVGKFDRQGNVHTSSTRYGPTYSVTGFLSDETGEIKIKLWGDFVQKLEDGTIIELIGAYVKNGILHNKREGKQIIHSNN